MVPCVSPSRIDRVRSSWSSSRFWFAGLLLVLLLVAVSSAAAPQHAELGPEKGERLFARIDEMLAEMSKMTGLELTRPIKRSIITREKIRDLVETRLKEEITPEEIRAEELTLKMFGFVGEDFDLAKQYVDVLTEQATALYDYQTKELYLATWTPEDLQEVALVHELAHALADQHFDLGKYVSKSRGADGDLARSAVLEGQASWIMVEYAMRQSGKSMVESPLLAVSAASASRFEARQYPTYSSAPLYIRESLLFPYTEGLLFQQAVVEKYGSAGFTEVFREPPVSSQQILDPEAYFGRRIPTKPRIPRVRLGRGYKTLSQGEIGEWDHSILLKKFIGEEEARELSPHWRGAYYKLRENKALGKDGAELLNVLTLGVALRRFLALGTRASVEGRAQEEPTEHAVANGREKDPAGHAWDVTPRLRGGQHPIELRTLEPTTTAQVALTTRRQVSGLGDHVPHRR